MLIVNTDHGFLLGEHASGHYHESTNHGHFPGGEDTGHQTQDHNNKDTVAQHLTHGVQRLFLLHGAAFDLTDLHVGLVRQKLGDKKYGDQDSEDAGYHQHRGVGPNCKGGIVPAIGLKITVVHHIVSGVGANGNDQKATGYRSDGHREHHFRGADVHLLAGVLDHRGNHYKGSDDTRYELAQYRGGYHIGHQYFCKGTAGGFQQGVGHLVNHLRPG